MNSLIKSRIFAIALLVFLPVSSWAVPAVPTPVSPLSEVTTVTPEFNWQHQTDAARYVLLVVDRSTGERVHRQAHLATDICSASQCSFTPDINLGFSNQHVWRVRSQNATGASAWATTVFAHKDDVPLIPIPIAPVDSTETSQPEFSWTHESGALSYMLLVVDRSTGERVHWEAHNQEDVCSDTTCSYTPDINLGFNNQHVWHVRSRNLTGASEWAKTVFAFQDDPPDVPQPLSPVTTPESLQPGFTWSTVIGATSYVLSIQDVTNDDRLHWKSYPGDEICSDDSCTVKAPVDLGYDTQYAWFVRAKHSTGGSAWARTDFSSIEDIAPKTVNPTDITDLILVTGQSNVRGSQTGYDPALDTIDLRVFAYTGNDDWEVADLHQAWDVDGWHPGNGSLEPHCLADPQCTPRQPYNNFAFHFAKTVVEQDPDRVVGVIIAGAPGEGIAHWDQNNTFAQTVKSKVLAALNAQGVKSQLDGILWHQGETDWQINGTSDPDASNFEKSYSSYYPEKLNSLISRFRAENWFAADKPFICGETKQAPLNERLLALNTDGDPWTGCIQATDLPTLEMDLTASPPEPGTHFTADGLRTLGERYGIKYLQMTAP